MLDKRLPGSRDRQIPRPGWSETALHQPDRHDEHRKGWRYEIPSQIFRYSVAILQCVWSAPTAAAFNAAEETMTDPYSQTCLAGVTLPEWSSPTYCTWLGYRGNQTLPPRQAGIPRERHYSVMKACLWHLHCPIILDFDWKHVKEVKKTVINWESCNGISAQKFT